MNEKPYFEIYQDKAGKFRYRVKSQEGKILLASPIKDSWESAAEVENIILGLRGALAEAEIRKEA